MEHEEIKIEYITSGGHGCMYLNAEVFFPCGVGILKKLLKNPISLCYWEQEEKIINQIKDHCHRAILEAEEYRKNLPEWYARTRDAIPELKLKVQFQEEAVSRIQTEKNNSKGQRKKDLADILRKAKEELKKRKASVRNAEAQSKKFLQDFNDLERKIGLYKKDLEVLEQRK